MRTLSFRNRKNIKKREGVSLVEVIIVVAISVIFVIIGLSASQGRGRRDFDNNMKLVVSKIKTLQTDALTNIGPDTTEDCSKYNDPSVTPPQPVPDTPCPIGSLIGTAMSFAPSAATKPGLDFGVIGSKSDGDVTQNYYTFTVAGVSLGAAYNVGKPKQIALPSNVAFKSSCITVSGTCNVSTTNPLLIVFARVGQVTPQKSGASFSTTGLGTYAFRNFDFTYSGAVPVVSFATCFFPYQPQYECNYKFADKDHLNNDKFELNFTDPSSRYHAKIIIDPKDNNSVSLVLS